MPRKIPTIANSVPASVMENIPRNQRRRSELIVSRLERFKDKRVFCKSLKDYVYISGNSIGETAHWACKSTISTIFALNMQGIIRNAVVVEEHKKPESRKQTRTFHFVEIIILYCYVNGFGTAKLTVGKRKKGKIFEYCVTRIRMEKADA